ncbi:brachyurin-like [Tribolium madens]|uniref:brachyurin-like n=1 Tax=Tribolium madens TaxID=41895 RepID=UPI001CF74825|nr:brachyurin-like [Tribolium madens]
MNLLILVSCFIIAFSAVSIKAKPGVRIIGGDDAPAGHFPFAAAIHVQTETSKFFCGGAVIAQQWILTSAHCVNGAILFTIQIGSNTLTTTDPERVTLSSSEYVVHPNFDPDRIENDIALIKLRMPVTYTWTIQPINLPPVSLLNNTEVTILGWGQTSDSDSSLSEHLKFVKATILSNAECQLIYGSQISDTMACVEGNFNEGTCTGDNGTPLVEYVSRSFWIVGVASFISGNGCESTDPSGYTRIFPYLDWIRNVTAS